MGWKEPWRWTLPDPLNPPRPSKTPTRSPTCKINQSFHPKSPQPFISAFSTQIIFNHPNNDVPAAGWFSLPPLIYEIYFLKQTLLRQQQGRHAAAHVAQQWARMIIEDRLTSGVQQTMGWPLTSPRWRPVCDLPGWGAWPCGDLAGRKRGRRTHPLREVFVFSGKTERRQKRGGESSRSQNGRPVASCSSKMAAAAAGF